VDILFSPVGLSRHVQCWFYVGEITMKLMIVAAAVLVLIATSAIAEPIKTRAINKTKTHLARVIMPPRDRYFDAAHGPNDPYSLWVAGDYTGRDPDPGIRGSMIREH